MVNSPYLLFKDFIFFKKRGFGGVSFSIPSPTQISSPPPWHRVSILYLEIKNLETKKKESIFVFY